MAVSDISIEYKNEDMKNPIHGLDFVSVDRMLRYGQSHSEEKMKECVSDDDEISVGCPSPVPDCYRDESRREENETLEKSPSNISVESSSPLSYHGSTSNNYSTYLRRSSIEYDSSAGFRRNSFTSSEDEDKNKGNAQKRKDMPDEYFKPLKRLKMMKIDKTSYSISERSKHSVKRSYRNNVRNHESIEDNNAGVKSFSICDILNHTPNKTTILCPSKIVRPWDSGNDEYPNSSYITAPPPAHRGILPQPHPFFLSQLHPHLAFHFPRPRSEEISSTYESCSSSGRSSTAGSDCCTSPDVLNCSISSSASKHQSQHRIRRPENVDTTRSRSAVASGNKNSKSSPLDALFQMTSKTFDELNGESSADGSSHANLFSNRQQPKKKRKSRTAFTNHQIFELEKRFLYQKYLSPADRDEIAAHLGLSNAQVITWFQNRRAKMKRDVEELKKDVESAKVLTQHSSFLENIHNLGILKKKPLSNNHQEINNDELAN